MIDIKAIRGGDFTDADVLAMCDEIERLQKDAARYRWIRHGDNDEIVMKGDCRGVYLPRNEHLDAAIDEQLEIESMKTYLAQDHVLNGAKT